MAHPTHLPDHKRGDLLNALPENGFQPIPGHPPDLTALPDGCAYAVRSPEHRDRCDGSLALRARGARWVACGMGAAG